MKNKAAKPMPGWMVIPVVIFCAIAAVWIFLSAPEHIEDENGPDNYALHTITDGDIIKGEYGSVGGPKISKSILTGDAVEFSAEKFTGVADILWDNLLGRSDITVSLANFQVTGGNFKMAVVHEDEIVAVLTPDLFVDYRLDNISGHVVLRIAGESASFSFAMSQSEYDRHSHAE